MPKRQQLGRTLVRIHFPDATGRARTRRVKRWTELATDGPTRLHRPKTRLERVENRRGAFESNNRNSKFYLWEPTR
ncbi:hypothetical protein ABZS53_15340 [Streptomyces sp. NPDC005499]|uniref:hypothetical protein n=1 Tax=Streptomyces sp. NPDC005499 TaxID=3154883 RepID=UPI0033ADCC5D